MYTLISVILGIVAIVAPIIPLCATSDKPHKFSFISFSVALLALFFQIAEYDSRVGWEDWVGLLDTTLFTLFASAAFVVVVLVLNLILYKKSKK